MTTVAYDGESVACDRFYQTCYGDKIARAGGKLVAFTGPPSLLQRLVDYFTNGTDLDLEDNEALVIDTETGEARIYDKEMEYCIVDVPVAIGSGWAVACGAMDAGADSAEAVRIASKYDGATKIDRGIQIEYVQTNHRP